MTKVEERSRILRIIKAKIVELHILADNEPGRMSEPGRHYLNQIDLLDWLMGEIENENT